jgi:hypothetical protein
MIFMGFTIGVVFIAICVAANVLAEQDTLLRSRSWPPLLSYRLPARLITLAEHGRVRSRRASHRIRADIDWEMNALVFLTVSALTMITSVVRKYVDDVARWAMSPTLSNEFTEWWEESWTNERKRTYHGRRRYEEVSQRTEWRNRWAEYDTQNWPTLATSGNAWDLVPTLSRMSEKALVICTGMTFNVTTHVMPVDHVARNLSESPRLLHSV